MLSITSTLLLVFLGLCATAAGAYAVNHRWPIGGRRVCNDAISCQLSILGTTYAVVLGFMLFNVWSEFRASSINVSAEAATLLEIYRSAGGCPPDVQQALRSDLHTYIDQVIRVEWPTMHDHRADSLPVEGDAIITKMIAVVNRPGLTANNSDFIESELSRLQEQRRQREEEYVHTMPAALWIILISGAVLVIGSICLLGGDSLLLYYTQVFSLSFVLLVILTAIADIDHPFNGSVAVAPTAFDHVRSLMRP